MEDDEARSMAKKREAVRVAQLALGVLQRR